MFLQNKKCHPYVTEPQIEGQRGSVIFLRSPVTTLLIIFHVVGGCEITG